MLAPVRTVAPSITPVSLADVKAHLRVDHTDDDAMIGALLAAATAHFDGWTGILGRCLVEQTWRQDFDAFARSLCLPLGPVISITSVTWRSAAGQVSTVASADYDLRTDAGGRAVIRFDDAYSFPSDLHESRALAVTYKSGYATIPEVPAVPGDGEEDPGTPAVPARSTVPEPVKLAIILHVKLNYDPLEPAVRESYQRAIDALVAPFRRVGV